MSVSDDNREHWRERAPFSADQTEKEAFFQQQMEQLTEHHRRSCQAYDDICHGLGTDGPYLPVALFKDLQLRSVPEEEVVRQVTSSGTTGQQVSRIYLNADTAELQRWALCSITGDFIGGKRLPMLIIDSPDVLRDRRKFSARGAGILGFSMMSSKRFYALDEQMRIDWESVERFLETANGGPSFAFGFTFMIWEYLYEVLVREGRKLDLGGCYLIHGGGWKKLQDRSVSDEVFREKLQEQCGFGQISDYYGMAEQTGSIFMQCPQGHLHASIFSDIQVLDPMDFSPCDTGEWGLIALRSWIPTSYPGHMLLTEDRGRVLGTDDCPCGRKGRYFEISGRIRKAEIRGCSDTFEGAALQGAGSDDVPGDDLQVLAGQWPFRQPEDESAKKESAKKEMDEDEPSGRKPFDPEVMSFLKELSQLFMKEPSYRQYPDVYALGFWLRPAHLKQLRERQEQTWKAATPSEGRRGRGIVLHIAPSNMPTMFAYSWITALLAGCSSVVRISGKESIITDTILQGIRQVLEKPAFAGLRADNAFVRFPRGHKALEEISNKAAARMIWGGDETVRRISSVPKPEDATDIPFPDKYSIALMDAQAIAGMSEEELRMQAHLFCRDTYGADQNACSSPRSVFWVSSGERRSADPHACRALLQETKRRWWDAAAAESERYELEAWMATEKYRLLCLAYARNRRLGQVQIRSNRLYVIPCGNTSEWIEREEGQPLPEGKLGMFFEFDLNEPRELFPLLREKIQTVVCVGNDPEEFLQAVRSAGCPGVDRAVHPGEALEFDTFWDRKDLIDMLTEPDTGGTK